MMKEFAMIVWGLVLWSGVRGQSSENPPAFQAAEERIAYNKSNNLPRYQGVWIEYLYELTPPPGQDLAWAEQFKAEIAGHFSGVLSAVCEESAPALFLRIRTEGQLSNHEQYEALARQYPTLLAKRPKNYGLL